MIREITIGQYYAVESPVHRLDPRTKLFGTMVFIISLFVADHILGYGLAAIFLAAYIGAVSYTHLDVYKRQMQ